MKQEILNNNILICGVPQTEDENLFGIAKNIIKAIDVELNDRDIQTVVRNSTSHENITIINAIVVKLHSENVKQQILIAKKTKRITTKIFDENVAVSEIRPIYINEHLKRSKQYLFKKARDLKRARNVKYAWVKNGEIRKTDDSIIKIKKGF